MFIYCICTQYLVGAPFALITASIRRGMEVISLWHCWGGMEAQVSLTVAFSSSALLGLVSLIFRETLNPHLICQSSFNLQDKNSWGFFSRVWHWNGFLPPDEEKEEKSSFKNISRSLDQLRANEKPVIPTNKILKTCFGKQMIIEKITVFSFVIVFEQGVLFQLSWIKVFCSRIGLGQLYQTHALEY